MTTARGHADPSSISSIAGPKLRDASTMKHSASVTADHDLTSVSLQNVDAALGDGIAGRDREERRRVARDQAGMPLSTNRESEACAASAPAVIVALTRSSILRIASPTSGRCQIHPCRGGTWTTSPSSSGRTLTWQLRRLEGFGS